MWDPSAVAIVAESSFMAAANVRFRPEADIHRTVRIIEKAASVEAAFRIIRP